MRVCVTMGQVLGLDRLYGQHLPIVRHSSASLGANINGKLSIDMHCIPYAICYVTGRTPTIDVTTDDRA